MIPNDYRMPVGLLGLVMALLLSVSPADAKIDGVRGSKFVFHAVQDYIITSDGDSFVMWGYALAAVDGEPVRPIRMQYPGPTLILREGQEVTIALYNRLPGAAGRTSIVFPGHQVKTTSGVPGLLTQEVGSSDPSDRVLYTFTAGNPGTYLYRSGTQAELQVEMGLVGAIIVRPKDFNQSTNRTAYGHPYTRYDREFLYLITEMDPTIHRHVEYGQYDRIDMTRYFPTNWFINGRNWPDLMSDAGVPWLPTQPYNCQPRMHPGERVLARFVGAGQDIHPMHLHGNDFETIAVDGRVLGTDPATTGANLAWKANTFRTVPGQTADVIWSWNAQFLGWDIYGHAPGDDLIPGEYAPDHGKPFPVILPTRDSLGWGAFYSGVPFLGGTGDFQPGDPGLNPNGAYFYMWHSHTEKELTSNDIWPGGLVSFMVIEHPEVPIEE